MTAVQRVKDLVAKHGLNGLHQQLYRSTGGRLGGSVGSMPVVMLATTGARTGKPRTTMLTAPVVDGEVIVLVASYGGDDRHPAWYHNLTAHPQVHATVHGRRRAMRARTATPGERAALWPRITRAYPGYGVYQAMTVREIPVVLVEPDLPSTTIR